MAKTTLNSAKMPVWVRLLTGSLSLDWCYCLFKSMLILVTFSLPAWDLTVLRINSFVPVTTLLFCTYHDFLCIHFIKTLFCLTLSTLSCKTVALPLHNKLTFSLNDWRLHSDLQDRLKCLHEFEHHFLFKPQKPPFLFSENGYIFIPLT